MEVDFLKIAHFFPPMAVENCVVDMCELGSNDFGPTFRCHLRCARMKNPEDILDYFCSTTDSRFKENPHKGSEPKGTQVFFYP